MLQFNDFDDDSGNDTRHKYTLRMLNASLIAFQLNFLVQKEILSAKSTRLRADVLAHFIKVAKVRLCQNVIWISSVRFAVVLHMRLVTELVF